MSRIGFIVGESKQDAVAAAQKKYCWQRIAIFRFVTTEKEDIRVIDTLAEFRSLGPGTKIFRAPGFEKRPDRDKWNEIIDSRLARWGEKWPEPDGSPVLAAGEDEI